MTKLGLGYVNKNIVVGRLSYKQCSNSINDICITGKKSMIQRERERSADAAESWRHGFKPFWHWWISAAQAETLQVCCFQNAWPQVAVVTVEQLHDSQ